VDERNRFTLPPELSLKNLDKISASVGQICVQGVDDGCSTFGKHFAGLVDDSLTWEFIPWLKTQTKRPILLKESDIFIHLLIRD